MQLLSLGLRKPTFRLIAAAVAAVLAGGAYAQQDPAREVDRAGEAQVARGGTQLQSLEQYLQSNTLRASNLIGMELQNRSGDNLGEVEDVLRGAAAGQDMQLIVAVGGFAGADEKLIAIPFDEVQISADGDELYTNSTRDQIVAAPAVALERRNVDARQPAVSTRQEAADGVRTDAQRQAADVDADGRAEALEDDDERNDTRQQRAGETPQGAQTNRATPPPPAAGQANQGARPGSGTVSSASISERRIGDLIGAEVIGADGESVGEIDDIVLSTAGADNMRAVLQVGGIAGLGEKRIALPLSQLQVQRDADGEPNVRVAMDLDALERQPEYEYEDRTSVL